MRLGSDIKVEANFEAWLQRPDGSAVEDSKRIGHNVFTDVGRDWLAHLCAWATVGGPDEPYTQRRVRWIGVGIGSWVEVASIIQLNSPVEATENQFLAAIQLSEQVGLSSVQFVKEFGAGEISFAGQPIPVTEAALYVDVGPASGSNGIDDSPVLPSVDFTLNPGVGTNPPVAYHTFDVVNKTQDFSLIFRWTFTF